MLVGLGGTLTCAYVGGGGMQWRGTYKPSRLSGGDVSRVSGRKSLLMLAGFCGWAVLLDAPARLEPTVPQDVREREIFCGRVLGDTSSRAQRLTCCALVGRSLTDRWAPVHDRISLDGSLWMHPSICSWSGNTALTPNTPLAATAPAPTVQSSGSTGRANTGWVGENRTPPEPLRLASYMAPSAARSSDS